MKTNLFKKSIKIQWLIRILLSITVISVFLPNNSLAKTAREIDVSVDVAIERFHKQVIRLDYQIYLIHLLNSF